MIESRKFSEGVSTYRQLEVDFIATDGVEKFYIQSAFALPDEDKKEQEIASLKKIDDSFRKIIIVGYDIATYIDDNGFIFMSLRQFLNNNKIVE